MKNYKRISVNGFDAKVLREFKWVSGYTDEFNSFSIDIPVDSKVSPSLIEKALADANIEANWVYVTHTRYVNYALRTVMTERSGNIERCSLYKRDESGKFVRVSTKTTNDIY